MIERPTANDLYRAARTLAAEGQPVFPCWPEGKGKAKSPIGSVVPNGFQDATLDPATIKRWWQRYRSAAIGIPTGIVWDVLDIDMKNKDGRAHLSRLRRHGLLDGCKRLVKTPSGGWHMYFNSSALKIRNKSKADLGLDVRGVGGYVLAATSWINDESKSVGSYVEFDKPSGGTDEPLMWDIILNTLAPVNEDTGEFIILPKLERQASINGLQMWLYDRQHGERNNALHWAIRRCLDQGIDPNSLTEVALNIGLGEEEIKASIDGAIKRTGAQVGDLIDEIDLGREQFSDV